MSMSNNQVEGLNVAASLAQQVDEENILKKSLELPSWSTNNAKRKGKEVHEERQYKQRISRSGTSMRFLVKDEDFSHEYNLSSQGQTVQQLLEGSDDNFLQLIFDMDLMTREDISFMDLLTKEEISDMYLMTRDDISFINLLTKSKIYQGL